MPLYLLTLMRPREGDVRRLVVCARDAGHAREVVINSPADELGPGPEGTAVWIDPQASTVARLKEWGAWRIICRDAD